MGILMGILPNIIPKMAYGVALPCHSAGNKRAKACQEYGNLLDVLLGVHGVNASKV